MPHEEDQQIPPMERRQNLGAADQFPHEVLVNYYNPYFSEHVC